MTQGLSLTIRLRSSSVLFTIFAFVRSCSIEGYQPHVNELECEIEQRSRIGFSYQDVGKLDVLMNTSSNE